MIETLTAGVALASAALAAGATAWLAHGRARPAEERLRVLEEQMGMERASARRRATEVSLLHERDLARLRTALGLPLVASVAEPVRGRRLAIAMQDRLRGLVGAEEVVVGDAQGLGWTQEGGPRETALASCCAAVLGERFLGQLPRQVHVELEDARHIVIRPVPGTEPSIALVVGAMSRPAPTIALDAVLAFAAAQLQHDGDDVSPVGLTGFESDVSGVASAAAEIVFELATEAKQASLGVLAVGAGDELLAGYAPDGPPGDALDALLSMMLRSARQLGHRLGGRVRRLDWTSRTGSTASLVLLGASGRSWSLAVRRDGLADAAVFDRVAGRLRRLLPQDGRAASAIDGENRP